jgi:hypothetical protein
MSKFPWKTTIVGAAILAATVYAYGQFSPGANGPMGMSGQMSQGGMAQMHQHMMQRQGGNMGQGMHDGMQGGMAMRGSMGGPGGMHGQQSGALNMPTMPGQDAFGAIQEVV